MPKGRFDPFFVSAKQTRKRKRRRDDDDADNDGGGGLGGARNSAGTEGERSRADGGGAGRRRTKDVKQKTKSAKKDRYKKPERLGNLFQGRGGGDGEGREQLTYAERLQRRKDGARAANARMAKERAERAAEEEAERERRRIKPKRDKNAPSEMRSTKPVSRFREVVHGASETAAAKSAVRDPRFDPLAGRLK